MFNLQIKRIDMTWTNLFFITDLHASWCYFLQVWTKWRYSEGLVILTWGAKSLTTLCCNYLWPHITTINQVRYHPYCTLLLICIEMYFLFINSFFKIKFVCLLQGRPVELQCRNILPKEWAKRKIVSWKISFSSFLVHDPFIPQIY